MEVHTGLFELTMLHPRLLWHDLSSAEFETLTGRLAFQE
jgi:hypothetical protein